MEPEQDKSWTFQQVDVPPVPHRIGGHPDHTGQGVTVAFLDAGFFPHPDLEDRVLAHVDVTSDREELGGKPEAWNWHGTMTACIACGSGGLGGGAYRGAASGASLVLVKVGKKLRFGKRNLALGLRWVIENQQKYNIRVVNVSVGLGESGVPSRRDLADVWVEKAVQAGLVVVVAAGNCAGMPPASPATAPSALTVGGYHDTTQGVRHGRLYPFNYGFTVDGVHKPDLLAPAAWVASPILPGTPQQERARALVRMLHAPEDEILTLAEDLWERAELFPDVVRFTPGELKELVRQMILCHKVLSPDYEHADGTSVAAPIVASVVAQMLEANPHLSPSMVRNILLSTARRLHGVPAQRQGHGLLNARAAVEMARRWNGAGELSPRVEEGKLVFWFLNEEARGVSLAGDFNGWTEAKLNRLPGGLWKAELEQPPPGRYAYKFVIDGRHWREDPSHGYKEPDRQGGLNSVLEVASKGRRRRAS